MPYLSLRENSDELEGNDRYEGYVADIASEVAAGVGIDYIIKPVKDEKYGSEDEEGNWNGMIGELIRGVSRHFYRTQHQILQSFSHSGLQTYLFHRITFLANLSHTRVAYTPMSGVLSFADY